MRLVFVFSFLFISFPYILFSQTNIVGGEDADIEDYPYQAALLYNSGGWSYAYCGASIINQYWILTAAHCVEGESANNTVVRVGSDNSYAQGGNTYDAAEIIIHNNYNSNTMNNDIALIKLENPISFNNSKQPVFVMCDEQVDLGVQNPGEMSWITGWGETEGTTNSSQLQVVEVPITTESSYGWGQIDADMIMAGYPDGEYDSCQGDSGGPMVVLAADGETYLQCGIVSWGSGCADPGYPGVYTRVSYFVNWICDNTDGDVCANESDFCTGNTVYGCTDLIAENYSSDATVDDGSCEYACDQTISLVIGFDCWPEETGWSITNETGSLVDSGNTGYYSSSSTTESICLPEGCYTFTITDSYGDGLGGSQWSGCSIDGNYDITIDSAVLVSGGGDFGNSSSHDFCIVNTIFGCIDLNACNYDLTATEDNGLCWYADTYYDCAGFCLNDADVDGVCDELEISGCTDSEAINYNPEATDEDGSCELGYSQSINLSTGWGIWSTYIEPTNMSMSSIFSEIINSVVIIKDQNGSVYWPEYNLNSIGDLQNGDGYQIKMNSNTVLNITGSLISSEFNIDLNVGWSLLGYLPLVCNNTEDMMLPMVDQMVIMKNEDGAVYWPEFGLNSIGNMCPGKGYQIKMNSSAIFNYPSNGRFGFSIVNSNQIIYYKTPINTGNNMIIGFPITSWDVYPSLGDEIAAFSQSGELVGSAIFNGENLALSVWGDDLTTHEKDGLSAGEHIVFNVWHNQTNTISELIIDQWNSGDNTYTIDGVSIASRIVLDDQLYNKQLIKIVDILGRKTNKKGFNFQIYNDGSVEKKYVY